MLACGYGSLSRAAFRTFLRTDGDGCMTADKPTAAMRVTFPSGSILCRGGRLRRLLRLLLVCVACAGTAAAAAPDSSAAASLRAKYAALSEQLGNNQYQRPLYLDSAETSGDLKG